MRYEIRQLDDNEFAVYDTDNDIIMCVCDDIDKARFIIRGISAL